MRLSPPQAQALYNHLISWNNAHPYNRSTPDGQRRTTAHQTIAAWLEAAASQGTLYELLVYLEGPLKQIVRSAFNPPRGSGFQHQEYVKPKKLGYSHKEVRKQVLIWLGSSFQVPSLSGDRNDHVRLLSVRWIDNMLLAGGASENAAETTRIARRLKTLELDDYDFHTEIVAAVFKNDHPFPYKPWVVAKWSCDYNPSVDPVQSAVTIETVSQLPEPVTLPKTRKPRPKASKPIF
jgi:hypothetical protein